VVLAALVAIAALLFVYQRASSTVVEPQGRQRPGRRSRPRTPTPARTTRDLSLFKHEHHRNGLKCSDCHTIPSATEPDRIAAADRPSSVRGYPYHDSCLRCHRQQAPQFFRGTSPVICTVCHTRVSPRLTARDVYPRFPSPKRDDKMAREYPAFFTHGKHQEAARQKEKLLDCATCHLADARGSVALPLKGIQSEGTFNKIKADTFRTIPGGREADAHASCAKCHWQENKPTLNDCNGCHLTRTEYTAKTLEVFQPPALSPNTARWFKGWPTGVPLRRSLKFPHDTHTRAADGTESNGHDIGCATCHVNIVQLTPQNPSKPDVEIAACAACHAKPEDTKIPLSQGGTTTILEEMTLKGDATKNYTCVACHTSVIGREQPPCSHYAAIEQTHPKCKGTGEE
jgi:hypothetical protein